MDKDSVLQITSQVMTDKLDDKQNENHETDEPPLKKYSDPMPLTTANNVF